MLKRSGRGPPAKRPCTSIGRDLACNGHRPQPDEENGGLLGEADVAPRVQHIGADAADRRGRGDGVRRIGGNGMRPCGQKQRDDERREDARESQDTRKRPQAQERVMREIRELLEARGNVVQICQPRKWVSKSRCRTAGWSERCSRGCSSRHHDTVSSGRGCRRFGSPTRRLERSVQARRRATATSSPRSHAPRGPVRARHPTRITLRSACARDSSRR